MKEVKYTFFDATNQPCFWTGSPYAVLWSTHVYRMYASAGAVRSVHAFAAGRWERCNLCTAVTADLYLDRSLVHTVVQSTR